MKSCYFLLIFLFCIASCKPLEKTTTPQKPTSGINRYPYSLRGEGDVTVVFETGMGDEMWVWGRVYFQISRIARAFCYHRPGIAGVPPSENPREAKYIVEELRTSLKDAGLKPPYILVGHSLGGLYMEHFARMYPDEVEGLALVEARPSNMTAMCLKTFSDKECTLSPEMVSYMLPYVRREYDGVIPSELQVQAAPPLFEEMPVYSLIAQDSSRTTAMNDLWFGLQVQRLEKMKSKRITLVPNSHHNLHTKEPEIVTAAIEELIGMVREKRKNEK